MSLLPPSLPLPQLLGLVLDFVIQLELWIRPRIYYVIYLGIAHPNLCSYLDILSNSRVFQLRRHRIRKPLTMRLGINVPII